MSTANATKTIKVTLVRGLIATKQEHRACVHGLGLRKRHQTVEVPDTPAIRGMISKVSYLLRCE